MRQAGKNGYCNECKPKNAVIDIFSLSADDQDRIRKRTDGLYKTLSLLTVKQRMGILPGPAYVLD